jgi:hypothetical protein
VDREVADGDPLEGVMGRVAGCDRLDEALFVVWTYCDQDFVRHELGKGVTKREVDVGLPRQSLNCFPRECVSSRLGNARRVAKALSSLASQSSTP